MKTQKLDPESRIVVVTERHGIAGVCPVYAVTHEKLAGIIVPPANPNKDRTKSDKERFKNRTRGKLDKKKLKDILDNNPVFGDKGKIKVPVEGGKEPRWRPGRDQKGGGKGRKGGKNPGQMNYTEMDYDEFIEWMFEDLDLPFMMKTDQATQLVESYRMRGLTNSGPEARIDWSETEISRIQRAISMLNAHPDNFPLINDFIFQRLLEVIKVLRQHELSNSDLLAVAEATLINLHEHQQDALPLTAPDYQSLVDLSVALTATASTKEVQSVLAGIATIVISRLERLVAGLKDHPNVLPHLVPQQEIPGTIDVPYSSEDFVYRRVVTKFEPDSKAVCFLILDRSGSMSGEPLAIAKFYFLLNILFLRSRYQDVRIIMVAHDAQAYEIDDEQKFYQIEVDGGTMFEPAYEMVYNIAEERFPVSSWNRYMFHATDGYMFDDDNVVTEWWTRLLSLGTACGSFRFGGYLEIDPWAGHGRQSWAPGGQALEDLTDEIKAHVGMARISSMNEVIDAFTAILTQEAEA